MTDSGAPFQAMEAFAKIFFATQRGRGRSTDLARTVSDGDMVVFENEQNRRHFGHIMRDIDRGEVTVDLVVCRVSDMHRLNEFRCRGVLRFDHSWLEQFVMFHISDGANFLDQTVGRVSGVKPPVFEGKYEPPIGVDPLSDLARVFGGRV